MSNIKEQAVERNQDCPCKNKSCPRNGICEKCQEFHHGRGEKTGCGK